MSTPTTQSLAGKVALITGASKGIGAATALELASLGAKVVINYSSDSTPADALVERIGANNAIAIKANAGSVTDIERLVKETVAWGGKIDILIPNAGIAINSTLEQTTEADFQKTYDLNVKGPYFLVQKALPHLSPGSHVILLSTSLCAVSTITPNYLLYASSKGAVEQMTRILAKDLGQKGINVNAVAPGPTGTDLFFKGKSQQLIDTISSWNPFKRLGQPEEIARSIAFLAGDGGSWVNGQILRVNGGMTVGN
ncbi:NAD(P)-binding protein [Ophiobolus disseminans]|uniref:NAD(P)-binding protein n=1 Tax=Ophiobolus disseminans TaxID=1469910 RepID=A0A6A6ZNF9_9PLEO|nr:NAD(P)-binding protein [Ophiobolus disseminans]